MKFGVREICDVVFKAKASQRIGNSDFVAGQPVLYIDTAKTSTIEGAATTVYAQGGVGNTRLIAWEGEKTLTFTVEDALLSPIGFSILSGAGLFNGSQSTTQVHVHSTAKAQIDVTGTTMTIDLSDSLKVVENTQEAIDDTAPIFVIVTEDDGSLTGQKITGMTAAVKGNGTAKVTLTKTITQESAEAQLGGKIAFVDFYIVKTATNVSELQIDASNFAGYYYVEASTLFRRQSDGVDLPAEITLPNVKIQSNFTFSMASTGDPSTFTFTMDAFPGYTYFDKTKQVLCVMQIVDEDGGAAENLESVMKHADGETVTQ